MSVSYDVTGTLRAQMAGHPPVIIDSRDRKTLTEKRFFEWHEDNVSVSLRAAGASYGGGSEVLIIERQSAPSAPETAKESETNTLMRESW